MLSGQDAAAIIEQCRVELARRNLLDFIRYTYPDYQAGWFHREVAAELDRFLDDVICKRSPRLILQAPPRSGKTEIVSRRFPAHALGKFPDLSFISTSYAADLSSRTNRDVQRIIDEPAYQKVFPGIGLNSSNVRTVAQGSWLRNSDIFEVVGHKGVYRSAGVCGGITGMGAHVAIVDDPIKDDIEATSEVYRQRVWDWFTSTLYTRLAPGGGILIVMTRWHEDDLVGRLLKAQASGESGDKWRVCRYPAIAEEDEANRKEGEALHPERYPVEQLQKIKVAVGQRVWVSLYQQRPSTAGGGIFKVDNWRYYKRPLIPADAASPVEYLVRHLGIRRIVQSWDTAHKAKQHNDFSACLTFGEVQDGWLLLDLVKRRMEFPELKRTAAAQAAKWKPHVILVEDKASGQSLIQELKLETRLPIVPVQVDTDKVARANAVSPLHEAGRFLLPEGEEWVADFVDSMASFPNAAHDDDVDAFTQGAGYLRQGGGAMGMFEWMRQKAEDHRAKTEAAKPAAPGAA